MMLAVLMYCNGLGVECLCQNQREIFFLAGSRLDKNSLFTISVVYEVWNSIEQELMASQVFWIIIKSLWYNKWVLQAFKKATKPRIEICKAEYFLRGVRRHLSSQIK